jgi:hypothetical protein
LDLITAQYFWLVDHNDGSRWFAMSSPPHICSSSYSFIGGVAEKKELNLDFLILLSRLTYWAPKEMLLLIKKEKGLWCESLCTKIEAGRSKVQRRNGLRVKWGTRYTFGGSWNWEWPGPSTTLATQLLELTASVSNPHLFDIFYYFFLRSPEVNFYLHNFGVQSSSFMSWLITLWLLDLLLVKYGHLVSEHLHWSLPVLEWGP